MTTLRNFMLAVLLLPAAAALTLSQERSGTPSATPVLTVIVSTSARGVRFTALGSARQIRLEVFDGVGESVYSSGFRAGNVRDWSLSDSHGQPLPDSTYLCVVTVRDISGKVYVKQGSLVLQGGQASMQMREARQPGSADIDKSLVPMTNDAATALTITAHDGAAGVVSSTRGGLIFRTGNFFAGSDTEHMRITPEGRVGIGTSDPQATLDVNGAIRARGGIVFDDGSVLKSATDAKKGGAVTAAVIGGTDVTPNVAGTGTANQIVKWTDATGTLGDSAMTETGGNISIGGTSPTYKMSIGSSVNGPDGIVSRGTGNTNAISQLRLEMKESTGDVLAGFDVYSKQHSITDRRGEAIFWTYNTSGFTVAAQDATSYFRVITGGTNFTANERFRITPAGNVGIGTQTPSQKLEVVGNLKVTGNADISGNIAAKYQDVAEWVPASEQLVAGTVVVLDGKHVNTVAAARRAYDTHVVGVVSAKPGLVLGEEGAGKALVATTGRVRVRVDARRRAVRVGDLLVTSGKAGAAMRSVPVRVGGARMHRPGTIIGKALEPLVSGEGEILVLLSLQ